MEINLRFGMHKDIELIHELKDLVDGLVIPANILAHQAPSTSVFVTSMPDKPYFVDPMTFMFQNPKKTLFKTGSMRPSVQKLCDDYNPGLVEAWDALNEDEFLTPHGLPPADQITDGVINFQLNKVKDASGESGASKYLKRYSNCKHTLPRFLVPPYFRFDSVGDEWFEYSLSCYNHAASMKTEVPIAPLLLFSLSALTPEGIDRICREYANAKSIIIWVDNYQQTSVTADQIQKARRLIQLLRKNGLRVETLYGGFLMILSEFDGLAAISHGILYTEHKSYGLTPGAGGAPERYYIPSIHEFRSLSQADYILHQHPELMCDCHVCAEVFKGNPDNFIRFADNPDLLRRHFLTIRKREVECITSSSKVDEIAALRDTHAKYNASFKDLPNPDAVTARSQMRGLDYLDTWANGIL